MHNGDTIKIAVWPNKINAPNAQKLDIRNIIKLVLCWFKADDSYSDLKADQLGDYLWKEYDQILSLEHEDRQRAINKTGVVEETLCYDFETGRELTRHEVISLGLTEIIKQVDCPGVIAMIPTEINGGREVTA